MFQPSTPICEQYKCISISHTHVCARAIPSENQYMKHYKKMNIC